LSLKNEQANNDYKSPIIDENISIQTVHALKGSLLTNSKQR